jgi:hypothetical protein
MLDSVFVSRARDLFGVPRAYVAVQRLESGLAPELVREGRAEVLFDGPHEVERWEVRARHGGVELERRSFRGAAPLAKSDTTQERGIKPSERYVLLAVQRAGRAMPMHAGLALKPGDEVSLALFREERDAAETALRALGLEERVEGED